MTETRRIMRRAFISCLAVLTVFALSNYITFAQFLRAVEIWCAFSFLCGGVYVAVRVAIAHEKRPARYEREHLRALADLQRLR